MGRTTELLLGMGIGAGLMYLLDPRTGNRRRAILRDKIRHGLHEGQDFLEDAGRDLANRAQGVVAETRSWFAGEDKLRRRTPWHVLHGGWSPSTRLLMGLGGFGLFAWGITQRAPQACVLGTAGLALAAESATNAGIGDAWDQVRDSIAPEISSAATPSRLREAVAAAAG